MSRRGVRAFALPADGELSIGRGPKSEIVIQEAKVSRQHAVLRVGVDVELVDQGSKNGTQVGGRRLESREHLRLAPGDVITVGSTLLRLQRVSPSKVRFVTRRELECRLEEERARPAARCALLVLELEPLARVNDSEVTAVTTRELLLASEVESALCGELDPSDLVSWAGASSYRVLLGADRASDAGRLSRALSETLSRWAVLGTVGVAVMPGDGEALVQLERAAAQAARPIERHHSAVPSVTPAAAATDALEPLVARVAPSTISVLILGETGVGKEVLASAIHKRSPRASARFVAVNCAALSESLFESELFGHERGAFTGADRGKPGLLEAASGGTLFLDEVGEMPLGLQVKLLRVLEQREVLRVGAVRPTPVDVRILSATHRDLESEIAARRFRQDLYFRLHGIAITLPPLRERRSEIEPLARRFIREACAGRADGPELTRDAILALEAHDWPGNIRELRNTMERAALLSAGHAIRREHLQLGRIGPPPNASRANLSGGEQDERRRIVEALERCVGNQSYAAESLGMSRRMLISRIEKYGIARPRSRRPRVS